MVECKYCDDEGILTVFEGGDAEDRLSDHIDDEHSDWYCSTCEEYPDGWIHEDDCMSCGEGICVNCWSKICPTCFRLWHEDCAPDDDECGDCEVPLSDD